MSGPRGGDRKKPGAARGGKPSPSSAKGERTPPASGVSPERLRREFPELTDEDLQAYVTVTQRLLADPLRRVQVLEEVKALAQAAQAKSAAGTPLSPDESLAAQYMRGIQKMQRRNQGTAR